MFKKIFFLSVIAVLLSVGLDTPPSLYLDPTIYLYPTETTAVTVQILPPSGTLYTEPPYQGGWQALVDPSGHLTDQKTNKEYVYLYWTGGVGNFGQGEKGWSVRMSDVPEFLDGKLKQFGLNREEREQFLEYWTPLLRSKPYYFITFLTREKIEELAPLNVTPEPDTVIRVVLDAVGLDEPKASNGYTITAPPRAGFTVVETGGILR